MINERQAQKYCRGDIAKIENYEKAVADTAHTWHLHHRLELTLDGKFAHSRDELKRLGMYFDRPYFELIFLTQSEHRRLHSSTLSDDTKQKLGKAHKGRHRSDETRKKISEAKKGSHHSEESKRKMSEAKKGENNPRYGKTAWNKGKQRSEETRKKISEAAKRRWSQQR